MTDEKRLYTKYSATCVGRLHGGLSDVFDVIIYGDISRGHNSRHIQLLLVVRKEGVFQKFVKYVKRQRKTYRNELSENICKQNAGKMLWHEAWPSDDAYKKFVEAIEDVDITVVPFNWKNRFDELNNNFDLRSLSRIYMLSAL